MDVATATILVTIVKAYVAAGVLFAAAFVWFGVTRIDPHARAAGLGFRLLIVPATAALWPVIAFWWATGRTLPRPEHNAHRPRRGHGVPTSRESTETTR